MEENRDVGPMPEEAEFRELALKNPKYTQVQSIEVQMRQEDFSAAQKASMGLKDFAGGDA